MEFRRWPCPLHILYSFAYGKTQAQFRITGISATAIFIRDLYGTNREESRYSLYNQRLLLYSYLTLKMCTHKKPAVEFWFSFGWFSNFPFECYWLEPHESLGCGCSWVCVRPKDCRLIAQNIRSEVLRCANKKCFYTCCVQIGRLHKRAS